MQMAHEMSAGDSDGPHHPSALRMALIASLTFNIGMGTIMGTSGVLLPHMRQYLGVSTEAVSAGMLAVIVAAAVFGPKIGSLAVRHSLRGILAAAAIMIAAVWALLCLTQSYVVFLLVNALLFGPSTAITGSILPPTIVTRWFHRNRGLAIGLCHLPILVAIMPLALEWTIQQIGLRPTFLVLAVLPLVTLLPASLLLKDWPPEQAVPTDGADVAPASHDTASHGVALTLGQILRQPRFWALTLAVGVPNASSMLLALHLVSMAKSWGIDPLAAAGLASIMAAVGMAGAVLLGMLADRIGGARLLAVIAICSTVLWLLLLTRPPFLGLAAIIGAIGLFGSGSVPAISKAYGECFGRASFSRAIGLTSLVGLPLMALGLILPGTAVRMTGSYTPIILGMAGAFAAAALLAMSAARATPRPGAEALRPAVQEA
jgi:cyanate permease